MHPNGANFLMADGSVRFLSSQIDHGIFASLATRAGNELVNLTDF
jgi:prepilin-type processing-associated H-X9-DG protein